MFPFKNHQLSLFLACAAALAASGCVQAVLDSEYTAERVTNDVAESDRSRGQPDAAPSEPSVDISEELNSAELDDLTDASVTVDVGDLTETDEPTGTGDLSDVDGPTDAGELSEVDGPLDTGDLNGVDGPTDANDLTEAGDSVDSAEDVVSDADGTLPGPLILSVDGVDATCPGNDGSATASPSGGTAPYTYSWSNGQTTQTIAGLGYGTYEVTVLDAGDGSANGSANIAVSCGSACSNNNSYYRDVTPSACPGSASDSSLWAGEYDEVTVNAGTTYTFSTCSDWAFDTQLTIYDSDGNLLAYNDDSCGLQSEIVITPTSTDTVRVVLDEWSCMSGSTFMTLDVSCD